MVDILVTDGRIHSLQQIMQIMIIQFIQIIHAILTIYWFLIISLSKILRY